MRGLHSILFSASIGLLLIACSQSQDGQVQTLAPRFESSSEDFWTIKKIGGEGTSLDEAATSHAYGYPLPSLSLDELDLHRTGDANFSRHFSDDAQRSEFGLGPVYNNTSCVACHNLDGRGSLPLGLAETRWTKLGVNEAIFLRISIENDAILKSDKNKANHFGAPRAVPGFSTQLFHVGTYGLRGVNSSDGQAEVWVTLKKSQFQYPDGQVTELSQPIFEIRNPYDGVSESSSLESESGSTKKPVSRLLQDDVRMSPRMGMPMYGLGLLESIPEKDLLKNAAIDRSSEGVHGIANMVWDAIKDKKGDPQPVSLGRFGLKGSTATIEHQSMAALNGDIGVTNLLFPSESIFGTALFEVFQRNHPSPLKIEASDSVMNSLVFYSKTLAVPPRRNIEDQDVIRGAKLFAQVHCTSCHVPSWETGVSKIRSLAYQKIYPYTDLLLHDMGEGLADNRQDFLANGKQWKTRALWGLGLTKVVNPRAGFLHDGRALTVEEAILWHRGEASHSLQKFSQLTKMERRQLLQFLQSL